MENNKLEKCFKNCRTSIYKSETSEFLLSRIAGSEQETDMSVPSNCEGYDVSTTLDVMLLIGCKIHYQMIQHVKH